MIKLYTMAGAGLALFAAGYWIADTEWQAKYDQHLLADAQANEKAATEALTKQQKLIKDLDDAQKATYALQEKHDRNVSDSRVAAERLRSELNRIKAMPPITHTSTIADRANAATDSRVLAELLRQSDYLAGRYAESAGSHQVALSACIAEYEAVRRNVSAER